MMTQTEKNVGFSLIELVIFIVITGILGSVVLLYSSTAIKNQATVKQQTIAYFTAEQCMEWFLGQRYTLGYASLACPSTPSASMCSTPAKYTIKISIACTTINSDSNFKTITVAVTGPTNATISSLIANY